MLPLFGKCILESMERGNSGGREEKRGRDKNNTQKTTIFGFLGFFFFCTLLFYKPKGIAASGIAL